MIIFLNSEKKEGAAMDKAERVENLLLKLYRRHGTGNCSSFYETRGGFLMPLCSNCNYIDFCKLGKTLKKLTGARRKEQLCGLH